MSPPPSGSSTDSLRRAALHSAKRPAGSCGRASTSCSGLCVRGERSKWGLFLLVGVIPFVGMKSDVLKYI